LSPGSNGGTFTFTAGRLNYPPAGDGKKDSQFKASTPRIELGAVRE